jgi:hypothetical protein
MSEVSTYPLNYIPTRRGLKDKMTADQKQLTAKMERLVSEVVGTLEGCWRGV